MKDVQPSVKVIRLRSVEVGSNQTALLDGGAAHVLRTARGDQEYERAVPVRVELASGRLCCAISRRLEHCWKKEGFS